MAEPKHPPAGASAPTPTPAPAATEKKQQQKYQDKLVIASRPARQGDDGYQLNSLESQVNITLEDGTEKVVKVSELTTP